MLNFSPETFDLLNLLFNAITFIMALVSFIFIIAIPIKDKWFKFRNPPDLQYGMDDDFDYVCGLIYDCDLDNYTPDSDKEKAIFERLVSRGIFAKTPTGSYKVTRAGKKSWMRLGQIKKKPIIIRIINKILPKKSKNP